MFPNREDSNRIGRHYDVLLITVIRVTDICFNGAISQIIIVSTLTLISPMEIVLEFFPDLNLFSVKTIKAIKPLQDLC